ncbi:MAG: hypothetical protein LBK67_00305 [Coriobacteriales bacterium]|jgi:hypothetical protein|nr:hypothetical protein [Coriobacteriales bacterium]
MNHRTSDSTERDHGIKTQAADISSRTKECPVCGLKTLRDDRDYSVCAVCLWEDDPIQRDAPDFWGGANSLSLNDYRAKWLAEHKRVSQGHRKKAIA